MPKEAELEQNCGTCRYWTAGPLYDDIGECDPPPDFTAVTEKSDNCPLWRWESEEEKSNA